VAGRVGLGGSLSLPDEPSASPSLVCRYLDDGFKESRQAVYSVLEGRPILIWEGQRRSPHSLAGTRARRPREPLGMLLALVVGPMLLLGWWGNR
jgi:hypothetical protein